MYVDEILSTSFLVMSLCDFGTGLIVTSLNTLDILCASILPCAHEICLNPYYLKEHHSLNLTHKKINK